MVLEQKFGSPKIVNDGVTVAKEVELEDPVENIGAKLVRQVSISATDLLNLLADCHVSVTLEIYHERRMRRVHGQPATRVLERIQPKRDTALSTFS